MSFPFINFISIAAMCFNNMHGNEKSNSRHKYKKEGYTHEWTACFMFSGQGSQYYHMGKELFKENTVFRQSMLEMDAIAARRIGTSIVEEIYHPGKRVSDPFDSILFPPRHFMIEYSLI